MYSDLAVEVSSDTIDILNAVYLADRRHPARGQADTIYGMRIVIDDTLPLYGWRIVEDKYCAPWGLPMRQARQECVLGGMRALIMRAVMYHAKAAIAELEVAHVDDEDRGQVTA